MFCSATTTMPNPTKKGDQLYYTLGDTYELRMAKSIQEVETLWSSLAPENNVFLQPSYLKALELYPPEKMGFRYLIFLKEGKAIGLAYVQTYFVRMEESVQNQGLPSGWWKRLKFNMRQWFIRRAVFNVIICGNLILTGEHGFYFPTTTLSLEQQTSLVAKGIDLLQKVEEKQGKKRIHIQLFKDYKSAKAGETEIKKGLVGTRYNEYTIQPSMYMKLPKKWKKFEDYLTDMSSKYRVRAKRAAKKGKALVKRELNIDELEARMDEIYTLYKNIATSVGFNAYTFHKKYFWSLKKHLGEHFKLIGFFLNDELVAFYTVVFTGHEMEAHFLGLNYAYNKEYQIYLNILYALVEMGIYHQVQKIDFARTALEIKSSIGAVPQEMHCYLRHRNRVSNSLIKFIFESLNPEEKWVARSPFKDMSIVQ